MPSPVPNTATLGPLTGIAPLSLAQPLPTTAADGSMSLPPALSASLSPSLTFPYPYFTSPPPTFPHPLPPTQSGGSSTTLTSVYAVLWRWSLPIVWRLARATLTQPAPNSKPAGSPPCDIPRSVGPRTPLLSPRWQSGYKPWFPLNSPYPHLYHLPHLIPPTPHPYHYPHLILHPHALSSYTTTPPQPPPSSFPLFCFGPYHRPSSVLPGRRRP